MADPTIFPFIDQLMTKIRNLSLCAPPVAVFDGLPTTTEADTIVSIGGMITPVSEGKQTFAQLGAIAMWENYLVDGVISAFGGGDSGTGVTTDPQGANAQRNSRQTATNIFNAIFEAIRADPNFATANGGTPLVLYCRIEDVAVRQEGNERGRFTEITFKILVKNRISAT